MFERNSPGKFDRGAAIDVADPFAGFGWSEIIEQQMRSAAGERFVELGAGANFDLDRNIGMLQQHPKPRARLPRRDVIVLDENRVEEAHAVVRYAAGARRHFLQVAQARGGLAGIENAAGGTFHRVDVSAPQGRDAAQMLQKIERDSFAREQHAGAAVDSRYFLARFQHRAVAHL